MKPAIALLLASLGLLLLADHWLGYEAAFEIGYGALSILALMIAATFLWLWFARATPLALGMAFSWIGAASVMGWWWLYNILGGPKLMVENEMFLVFLATYLVGAGLHFTVVQKSFGLSGQVMALPVAGAVVTSVLVHALI